MIDEGEWNQLRGLFAATLTNSFHFSIASIGPQGMPWVTPVGSVLLHEPGHASYFELFAHGLGRRLEAEPRMSMLAVDSGRLRWMKALLRGRFERPPAVRLRGVAETATRPATDIEIARMLKRVRGVRHLKGGKVLWGKMDVPVRHLRIERIEHIRLGSLTKGVPSGRHSHATSA